MNPVKTLDPRPTISRIAKYAPDIWARFDEARAHHRSNSFLNWRVLMRAYFGREEDIRRTGQAKVVIGMPGLGMIGDMPVSAQVTDEGSIAVSTDASFLAHLNKMAHELTLFAQWRQTQGIYLFDEDFGAEIDDTDVEDIKQIPVDALTRTPEPVIYLSLGKNYDVDGDIYDSVFCGVLPKFNEGHRNLLLLTFVNGTHNGADPYHIGFDLSAQNWLEDSLERHHTPVSMGGIDVARTMIVSAVNRLLYLCSDKPDLSGIPPRPADPVVTRRGGVRFFPAERTTPIQVGVRFGVAFRKYREESAARGEAGPPTGRTMPPHMRKRHWHLYWIGPRNAPVRDYRLHWLPPIPVNISSEEDLAPTIHRVKAPGREPGTPST